MAKHGASSSRITVYLDEESHRQIEILSQTFRINSSNVISMAIARWFHSESLVREKQGKDNGTDHSGL